MSTELGIVIVSFNTRAELDGCLASLHAAPPAVGHEIVVVDNASSDGSAALVRGRWPAVRLVEAGQNLGFARASNLGIRQCRGNLILLLNSDTSVPPGAIDRLVADLRAHDDVAVVGPRLVDGRGRAELSFGPMVGPLAELRQKLLVGAHVRGVRLVARQVERWARQVRHPDWVSGACLLVRRSDAEAVGLLDERFFMYLEDVDFCAAVRARGRRIRFTPSAEIVHLRGRSVAARARETALAYRRSQLALYAKHRPGWMPWLRAYLWLKGELPDSSRGLR